MIHKNYRHQNAEVIYTKDVITTVNKSDIENLHQLSIQNPRKRLRLCTHQKKNDLLHEMLILHDKNAYVRPHKHPGKSESMHIIEGIVDLIIFNDVGQIESVINMGNYSSDKIFYYRMEVPIFHTLIIQSDLLVFQETTNGPFIKNETIFAPWSPKDSDLIAVEKYMSNLKNFLRKLKNKD